MSHKKIAKSDNSQEFKKKNLVKQYVEIMRMVSKVQLTPMQPSTSLKQPSVLEEVDSITVYGVNDN